MPKSTFHRMRKKLVEGGYVERRKGVGYAFTLAGKAELVPGATRSHPGAMTPQVPSATWSHTPVGGGTKDGTKTKRSDEELERDAIQAEGAAR